MSQTDYVDPRSSVDIDIEPGMVFRDTRPETPRKIIVEYADPDGVVLFRDTEGDRNRDEIFCRDTYEAFERSVGAGRYTPVRDDENRIKRASWVSRIERLRDQYEQTDGRTADHKAEAIGEVLDLIANDVPDDHNETVDFESIDGIGSKAAENLRDAGFRTKGDVREASKEQLIDVDLMGESNTENLLDCVQ